MKKAIITVGLGFGDEGKGAWVDALCVKERVDLVVRYSGGSQCGHNVQIPADEKLGGKRHTFSQVGAGAFCGVRTYLAPQVIINPPALAREILSLNQEFSLSLDHDLWGQVYVDERCLVSTIYHQMVNQAMETTRNDSPDGPRRHGSCGHGIGETRRYWLQYGNDAVFAADLKDHRVLGSKLELMRQRLQAQAERTGNGLDLRVESVRKQTVRLWEIGKMLRVIGHVPDFQLAVFEGAQGVLLDEWCGFFPYVTHSTVTTQHALDLCREAGVEEVCTLGLTRTYTTRHGAGPFPTHSKRLTAELPPDLGNPTNEWQGTFRCGFLDLPLTKYAVDCCELFGSVDGLLVSHLDQYPGRVCQRHFSRVGEVETEFVLPMEPPNLERQRRVGEVLGGCYNDIVELDRVGMLDRLGQIRPVCGTAVGPTFKDRLFAGVLPFRRLR